MSGKTKTAEITEISMFSSGLNMVEAAGFEPVAFASRTESQTTKFQPFRATVQH